MWLERTASYCLSAKPVTNSHVYMFLFIFWFHLSGSGKDYLDISEQLIFTKSDKHCLNISTNQDSVYEEDEKLTVKLSHTKGTQTVSVTITDDDEVHLSLLTSGNSVCEGVGMVDIIVNLESAIERDVVVQVKSFNNSAKGKICFATLPSSLTTKAINTTRAS